MANGTPDTSGRRVLRILQYLARHQRPVLASAIARDCGLPRSSTYRLLHVMAEERFVTYYPDDGRWGLGLAAYELGTGYLLSDPLSPSSGRHPRRGWPPRPGRSWPSGCSTAPTSWSPAPTSRRQRRILGGGAVRGPLIPPT